MPSKLKPKFLVRFRPGEHYAVRTITEAYRLIEARHPACWPPIEQYRLQRHPAGSCVQVFKNPQPQNGLEARVADIYRIGGVPECFGTPPPLTGCITCVLRYACQRELKTGHI